MSAVAAITSFIEHAGAAAPAAPASPTPLSSAAEDGGAGFTDILNDVVTSAMDTMKAGEATAIGAMTGQATTQQAVEAVMAAERTFHTALAIRDKVVSAYMEISRMQI